MITYSVTEINNHIKKIVENSEILKRFLLIGEITNLTNYSSGHLYFGVKDENSQIKVVMFQNYADNLRFTPKNGMKVIIEGSIGVYGKTGGYQVYAYSMQPDGIGALYLAYEQLKAKLEKEGLFNKEHKKPIPKIPRTIGIITSATGAAVHDIINITGRRWPQAELFLYPSKVQGDGTAKELIRALNFFENKKKVDVIIIGRGGGSIEDLWEFNNEELARTIYEMTIPIISAVGHETDFTICDFVSDLRAPTPSAAAELVVPDRENIIKWLDSAKTIIKKSSSSLVNEKRNDLIYKESHLRDLLKLKVNTKRHTLQLLAERLEAINPLATLSRGYSFVKKDEHVVTDVGELKVGERLTITMKNGEVDASISSIKERVI